MSTLTATQLNKQYKGREVVEDVSLEIRSGEVVGLLGPNGAGKTTCFYMIVGLVPMDRGTIRLDDTDIGALPMHRRARLGVGYLPQEPSIFRHLSVRDNILAILETREDLDARERLEKLEQLIGDLQITGRRDALGISLSGGERRRVEIATLLAQDPPIRLLDEPINHLDLRHQIKMLRLLTAERMRPDGFNVVVLHDVNLAVRFCTHALLLFGNGECLYGKLAEVLQDTVLERLYGCPIKRIEADGELFYTPA